MSNIQWPEVARLMLTSRAVDHLEETELVPNGKVTYQFSARGHELAQVLLALSLDAPHDAAGVYYRSRPLLFASGLKIDEALAGSMAKATGLTGGRDIGVVHMLDRRGRALVLPTAGDVGSQYTPAVGWAQAIRYHQRVLHADDWAGSIVVACGGDGSTAANGFWAALNIVTTQNLPYLFFIEDNAYGISVPGSYQTPGGNLAKNLASFSNLCVLEGDGADPIEAASKIDQAVSHVRANNGPALLRLSVPRLNGHSFVDNQSYKAKELREAEAARDPMTKLKAYVIANSIMTDGEWTQLEQQIEREVRAACDEVLAQPEPDPNSATKHVFYEGAAPHPPTPSPEIKSLISGEGERPTPLSNRPLLSIGEGRPEVGVRLNLLDAVKRTLEAELIANPRLLIFGEDVGVKGGVHGATTDMQLKHGAERVFDTSLNEDGIIGRSAGLAFAGLMPVPEIQFRKYADPAMEQINNIGTLRWRTLGKFAAPMVVRIPVGFGRKTGDPWHSVSGEAVHAKSLGWRIAIPSNAEDAVGLLRTALRGNDPTFFYEHRALLDTAPARRPYPGDDYMLPFGVANIVQSGDDLTVITWGAMVHRCAEAIAAAAEGRGSIEMIDLRTIVPWDKSTVLKSIAKTGKCLIVHEDGITGGFGAEIAATIAQEAFFDLDAPIVRVATLDVPIPYNANLMHAVTPTVEKIRAEMERLIRL